MTQIPTWNGGQVSPPNGRAAPGATIGGRYELRTAVGHGGMGTVWKAVDTLLRRDVAVKEVVLPPGLAPSDRDALYERTLREARAAAAIQHPAVVQVYDVVTESGRPWIVMELLEARSLADMVIEDGPVAPRAVAKIGIALLGALEVAHAIGVLHRDVKPANVLICADGRCVLTDFGVARMPTDVQLTTPGMVLGSPHFISPERALGQDFGPPSDLFSLGVTLYTAVEGRPPFDRGDPIETMHAVVEDEPAPPVRSGPLTRVLFGLLEKDPTQRINVHSARSMLRELLTGPLASKAPTDPMTDPYAVVPVPRAQWQPPAPAPAPMAAPAPAAAEPMSSGQIGGRAMLAPGESLTDRLAELRKREAAGADDSSADDDAGTPSAAVAAVALSTPTGAMSAPTPEATGAAAATQSTATGTPADGESWQQPTGAMPPPGVGSSATTPGWDQPTGLVTDNRVLTGTVVPGPGGFSPTSPAGPDAAGPTGFVPSGFGPGGGYPVGGVPGGVYPTGAAMGGAPGGQPSGVYGGAGGTYGAGQPGGTYGAGQPGGFYGAGGPAGSPAGGYPGAGQYGSGDPAGGNSGGIVATIKGLPRKVQLGVAGGVAAVLVIVLSLVLFSGGDDPAPPVVPQAGPSASGQAGALETQVYAEKGVSINVPKGWTRKSGGASYVDFVDPDDAGRRVRVIVEGFKGDDPRRWAEVASNGLEGNTRSCARPYEPYDITDQQLAGKPAAEFEYKCGEGDAMRHGVWRGVVGGGKAYSFYLTSSDPRFEESKPIFDEMVRSFQLTDAG